LPRVNSSAAESRESFREEIPMQYMLMIYGDEKAMQTATREDMGAMMGAYAAYTKALQDAKVMLAGNPLRPSSTATTVRLAGGKSKVINGPYAETKEQLGGYYILDVPDLDAALSWAARCPGANYGIIEVRPIGEM
jgi:hypothetical protein